MIFFPEAVQTTLTGTVATTAGSRNVVGSGTLFTTELKFTATGSPQARQAILINGEIRDVVSVTDNLNLTVEYPFANTNLAASNVAIVRLDSKSNRLVDSFHPFPVVLTSSTGGGPVGTGASVVRIEDAAGTALASVRPGNVDAVSAALNGIQVQSELAAFNGTTYDRLRAISPNGAGLGTLQAIQPQSQQGYAAANNAAAIVTFAAVTGQAHYLTGLIFSYDAAPAPAGGITIQQGGSTIMSFDVLTGGTFAIPLPPGGVGNGVAGSNMVITLAASGVTGVTGKVTAMKVTY